MRKLFYTAIMLVAAFTVTAQPKNIAVNGSLEDSNGKLGGPWNRTNFFDATTGYGGANWAFWHTGTADAFGTGSPLESATGPKAFVVDKTTYPVLQGKRCMDIQIRAWSSHASKSDYWIRATAVNVRVKKDTFYRMVIFARPSYFDTKDSTKKDPFYVNYVMADKGTSNEQRRSAPTLTMNQWNKLSLVFQNTKAQDSMTVTIQMHLAKNATLNVPIDILIDSFYQVASVIQDAYVYPSGDSIGVEMGWGILKAGSSANGFTVKVNGVANAVKSINIPKDSAKLVVINLTNKIKPTDKNITVSYDSNLGNIAMPGVAGDGPPAGITKALSFNNEWVENKSVTQTGVKKAKIAKVAKLYPNPAVDQVTIEGVDAGTTVQIASVDGKVVKCVKAKADKVTISVKSLKKGTYVVKAGTSSLKLVK